MGEKIEGAQEDALRCLGENFAVTLGLLAGVLPSGIGSEGLPIGGGLLPVGVMNEIDQCVCRVGGVEGYPVAEILHAMLGEELGGMVVKTLVEGVELARVGHVSSKFENASFLVDGIADLSGVIRFVHEDARSFL